MSGYAFRHTALGRDETRLQPLRLSCQRLKPFVFAALNGIAERYALIRTAHTPSTPTFLHPLYWIENEERFTIIVRPARNLRGSVSLPGDKSISHRYAMLAAIAEGPSRFENYSTGADCASTLGCLRSLGVSWEP